MDILSKSRPTIPISDLISRIGQLGWTVGKIKYDKSNDQYIAEAKSPKGKKVQKTGESEHWALAHLLMDITRRAHAKTAVQEKISMWRYMFIDKLPSIAEAYSSAPIYDPKASVYFKELADDCEYRARIIGEQISIKTTGNPEPYKNIQALIDDVQKRRKLVVSEANAEHPAWTPEQVVNFRICHDILGYVAAGADWSWQGANLAFAAHAPLLSATAQEALFCEALAKIAYSTYYQGYGQQKVAAFPKFLQVAQEIEGIEPVHPAQTSVSVSSPGLYSNLEDFRLSSISKDPNENWESHIDPLPINGYIHHGDPLDIPSLMDKAHQLNTDWHKATDGNGNEDYDSMNHAIQNAFRAVLLAPRKSLRHGAMHYQDLLSVPATATNPETYHDVLTHKAKEQNKFVKQHEEFIPILESIIYQMSPHAGHQTAKDKAKRILFDWKTEEQNKILNEDKLADKQRSANEVDQLSDKMLSKRLKLFTKDHNKNLDYLASGPDLSEIEEYPAILHDQLKSIAKVAEHSPKILQSALDDVHKHGGKGHHFRSEVLNLEIPGIGPKTASMVWFLLNPLTSDIAPIDSDITKLLGKRHEDLTPRDYYLFERMLKAGRDASGYNHIPLGLFAYAMKGAPDFSVLKPKHPKHHSETDDSTKSFPTDWWNNVKPILKQIEDEWEPIAALNPSNQIPKKSKFVISDIVPLSTPWILHPKTKERIEGTPGQSMMEIARECLGDADPREVWDQIEDGGFIPQSVGSFIPQRQQ